MLKCLTAACYQYSPSVSFSVSTTPSSCPPPRRRSGPTFSSSSRSPSLSFSPPTSSSRRYSDTSCPGFRPSSALREVLQVSLLPALLFPLLTCFSVDDDLSLPGDEPGQGPAELLGPQATISSQLRGLSMRVSHSTSFLLKSRRACYTNFKSILTTLKTLRLLRNI